MPSPMGGLGAIGLGVALLLCLVTPAHGQLQIRDQFKGDRGDILTECMCYNVTLGGPCEGANDKCMDYVKEVAKEVWPSILFWVIFILICFWRCFRCCCKTCGSSVPSKGCCGKGISEGFRGYSLPEHTFYRGIVFSVIIFSVALIPGGMAKNQQVTDGFIDIGNTLDRWSDGINNTIAVLVYEFGLLPASISPPEVQQSIANAQTQIGDALESVTDAKESFLDYDHRKTYSRKRVTFLFGALMLLGALITGIVGLLGLHELIIVGVNVSLLFILATLCFVATLLAHVIGIFTDDICANYGPLTDDLLGRVSTELGCTETSTENFAEILNQTETVKANMATEICQATQYLCQFFVCSAAVTMQPCLANPTVYIDVMDEFLNLHITPVVLGVQPFDTCTDRPCTLQACEAQCRDGDVQNYLEYLLKAARVVSILEMQVYPVANCLSMYTLRDEIGEPLCDKVSAGFVTIFFLLLCVLILYDSAAIFITLGQKRYAWKYVTLERVEVYDDDVDASYRPWFDKEDAEEAAMMGALTGKTGENVKHQPDGEGGAAQPSAPPLDEDEGDDTGGKQPAPLPGSTEDDAADANGGGGANVGCVAAPLPPPQSGSSSDDPPASSDAAGGGDEEATPASNTMEADANTPAQPVVQDVDDVEAADEGGATADAKADAQPADDAAQPESDMAVETVDTSTPQSPPKDPPEDPSPAPAALQTPEKADVIEPTGATEGAKEDSPIQSPAAGGAATAGEGEA